MRQLRVRPLVTERIPQCLPLCRLEVPELSQDRWEAFARSHIRASDGPSPGILIAEDHRSCILGLLVHSIDQDLLRGRVLHAKWMIVQDYFPTARQEVALALLAALEDLAGASACRSIQTSLPVPDGETEPRWLKGVLQTRGHRQDSFRFCKTLDGSSIEATSV